MLPMAMQWTHANPHLRTGGISKRQESEEVILRIRQELQTQLFRR